jgi:serine/threonine protein kinase
MGKDHFEPIKLIGRGGFSRVIEARKKDTGQLYALKLMSKSFIIQEDKVRQILTERKLLADTEHPFIVRLHWAFQSVRTS